MRWEVCSVSPLLSRSELLLLSNCPASSVSYPRYVCMSKAVCEIVLRSSDAVECYVSSVKWL